MKYSPTQPHRKARKPVDELQSLFQLSLDLLCVAGMDGYFKQVNPAFERTLGYSELQLLARPFIDFVHPDDREATLKATMCLSEGRTICRFDNRYRCRDGSYRWLSWTAAPGGNHRIYAVACDTTSSRQAEELLRQSQRRYEQLLEAVVTYTYSVEIHQGEARCTTHSPGSISVTGFSAEEFERNPLLWYQMIHSEDRARVMAHLNSLLAGEPVAPIEHRILDKVGQVRWLRSTPVPHQDSAGVLIRYDGVVQDITDQKRESSRFKALVECAPDAIVVTDAHGRMVHVNRRTEELFGHVRDDLLGQPVELLVPERLRPAHVAHRDGFVQLPTGRRMGDRPDLACRRKDGSEFPAEISLSIISDGDEEKLVFAAIRDVSEFRSLHRRNLDNHAEHLAARGIQQRLLPQSPPSLEGFDIAAASYPMSLTGGDMFDYIPLEDGSIGLVVGDVSGHGIAAALVMASTHAYLRLLGTTSSDVGQILTRANEIITRETEENRFVTLVLCRLDPRTHALNYSNAGHPTGYVLDGDGTIKTCLASTYFPLGIVADAEFPGVGPIVLESSQLLLLTTDGVLEVRGPEGRQFGTERLLTVVRENLHRPAAAIIAVLHRAILDFCGREVPDDDATVMVVKVLRSAQRRTK